jgi:hypothetical protein
LIVVMSAQKREARLRARRRGHPRLEQEEGVDARDRRAEATPFLERLCPAGRLELSSRA